MANKDSFLYLDKLWKTILARADQSSAEESYVVSLLSKGPEECARKLGEEGIETMIASIQKNNKESIIHEAADLLFHLLVLLKATDTDPYSVMNELQKRENISGHDEKKSRVMKK
jgi:phosphoribosyl-ATP pyrophosphohydrolase